MVSEKFINKWKLDEEEKEVSTKENELFFEKATNDLKSKNKLISLRVNETVINNIKQKSAKIGINYQTLINILLKQYSDDKITITL